VVISRDDLWLVSGGGEGNHEELKGCEVERTSGALDYTKIVYSVAQRDNALHSIYEDT
jgi:hypothetical protein